MAAAGLPVGGSRPRRRWRRDGLLRPGPSTSMPGSTLAASLGPQGLVAGVVQDVADGRVLMVAWMDAEALAATLATGEVHFHSRSRGRLWRKGETSGNVLRLRVARARLRRRRAPRRRGARSARPATAGRGAASIPTDARRPGGAPMELRRERRRRGSPGSRRSGRRSPSARRRGPRAPTRSTLLDGGVDAVGRKVTEEATEVLLAAKDDAAAEAAGADRDGDPRGSRRRGRRPRSTTRSSCSPSAASTPRAVIDVLAGAATA